METKNNEDAERGKIMALKTLLLRSKLDKLKKSLEELRGKDADFEKREKEFEEAIDELNDEASEEDQKEIEDQISAFQGEKDGHEKEKSDLEEEISKIEGEIAAEEEKRSKQIEKPEKKAEKREGVKVVENRTKFYGMSVQERDAFFAREDVKDFLGVVRTCIKEKRAIANAGLIIPEVMLELLKQRTEETSKLIGLVNLRRVTGSARQRIMGEIPEAIWTEMCANLNELELSFYDTEIDGYKVGGYFAICNAILEDNDVALASEIINALGKAIGKALDKAIVYGTGTKMPLGIVTRLAQTAAPSDYPATSRAWADLSASNILTGTGATGINLFKEIVRSAGTIVNDYADGSITWMMSKKTHMDLTVQSMDKNLNAAIVAGISTQMPVIGGNIVELPFIPDNNIVFGYMDMYLLAERAGTAIGQSEHYKFLEDQTVFKGMARYDGQPVIPESFAVITTDATAPTTSVTFPADIAN